MENIYVIGHLTPDTDTVVSAITLARFLNSKEKTDRYVPAMTGKANSETEYIFKKFNVNLPMIMEDATGKELYLVDHNEESQIVKGHEMDKIIGFVDHHKINFKNSKPVCIVTRPWGSTNSIIYSMYKKNGVDLPDEIKPLMLCAILSDTVILKSPTTTPKDMEIVNALSEELDIDYEELGMEMFKAKAQVASKTAEEILKNDFKDFDFSGKKVGVGQIETPDLKEVMEKVESIKARMKYLLENEGYHTVILMMTDIIEEGTKLLIVSHDEESIAEMFNTKLTSNVSEFIPGMMSRKKQVAPVLSDNL